MTTNNNKQVFWLQIILRIRYLVLDHIPVDILFWGGSQSSNRVYVGAGLSACWATSSRGPAQLDSFSKIAPPRPKKKNIKYEMLISWANFQRVLGEKYGEIN